MTVQTSLSGKIDIEFVPALLGVAAKSIVVGFVKGFLAGLKFDLGDDIIAGIIGYLLYAKTHGFARSFGFGILLAAVAGFVQPMITSFAGGFLARKDTSGISSAAKSSNPYQ